MLLSIMDITITVTTVTGAAITMLTPSLIANTTTLMLIAITITWVWCARKTMKVYKSCTPVVLTH